VYVVQPISYGSNHSMACASAVLVEREEESPGLVWWFMPCTRGKRHLWHRPGDVTAGGGSAAPTETALTWHASQSVKLNKKSNYASMPQHTLPGRRRLLNLLS
jgi:hypothetical protein